MEKHGNLGKKRSPETIKKMSLAHMGQPSYWTGKKRPPHTEEARKKISLAGMGRKVSEETRQKHREVALRTKLGYWSQGKKLSAERRKKLSEANKGEKSHFWKGGIHPINFKLRKSVEYKLWKEAVLERDKYTCIFCGTTKEVSRIEADHIKPFAYYPELRFAIDNGRALCQSCHRKTDTYGRKAKFNG